MCVYQSHVYISVSTYAMQVMRELDRFLLKHLCINQTKTKKHMIMVFLYWVLFLK